MTHRAKHRQRALLGRVLGGRTIKTDLTAGGRAAYLAVRDSLSKEDQAIHFMRLRLHSQHACQDKPAKVAERRLLPVQGFLRNMW